MAQVKKLYPCSKPIKVEGNEANNAVLDNLRISKSASGIKYQSLTQSTQFFLEEFPEGFYGDKFKEHERNYKEKAHALALELLGKQAFFGLLESEGYSEIVERALTVTNATNLIFPNEKMSLKDGLRSSEAQKNSCRALYSLLYGAGELEKRFAGFSRILEKINAAKWTTASYFLFIIHPDKYMFVKLTITQYSSELCGYEINYKPQLNWPTCKFVLGFSEYIRSEISELTPRDMIDVQSFVWCIAHLTNHGAYKRFKWIAAATQLPFKRALVLRSRATMFNIFRKPSLDERLIRNISFICFNFDAI